MSTSDHSTRPPTPSPSTYRASLESPEQRRQLHRLGEQTLLIAGQRLVEHARPTRKAHRHLRITRLGNRTHDAVVSATTVSHGL
jgi:hypothetical protein